MRTRFSVAAVVGATLLTACNLDLNNPNTPTEKDVLTTREGIVALAIGLQARYGAGMVDFMFPVGLLTDELGATPGALQSYKDAENNVLLNTYDAVQVPWASHYRTIKTANDLIVNAPNVTLGDSTLSGILTISYLFKAMSLGELLQLYERIPIDTYDNPTPPFVDRTGTLSAVLWLLDSALTQYNAVRPGSEFNTSIRASGLNVKNTIFAMQGRYHRLAGNDAAALAAADSVDPSVLSFMPFSDQALNPIYDLSFRAAYVKPRDAWRLSLDSTADSLDGRKTYHVTVATISGNVSALDNLAQHTAANSPIPFYYPGEMHLIIAEALTNLGNTAAARDTVNFIRTRCGGALNEPKACLAALPDTLLDTPSELLDEIYRQRRYELFATGLRWEDARRRDAIGGGGFAKRCWLLYPRTDRETNPNTPADPPDTLTAC
jgi:hypothetical protein